MSLLHSATRKRARTSEGPEMDIPGHDSCVIRDFPRHKTAHLRFITSIYTRKYAPDDTAQRICPILECPGEFTDKEAMCQHLYHCPHLTKGRYWCLDCRKGERISKFHCKRCPSRASSVAKKFFSLLGPKSHHGTEDIAELDNGMSQTVGEEPWSEFLKRSETSKENRDAWGFSPDANLPVNRDVSANWAATTYSAQQFPVDPPAFTDWSVPPYPSQSHELPDLPENSPSELPASYEQPSELVGEKSDMDMMWDDKEDWWLNPPEPTSRPSAQLPPSHPQRLLTPLNTQNLYPAINQYHSPVDNYGLLSSDVVSPLSPTSQGMSFQNMLPSITISPTDSEMSGQSLFTDSSYSTATSTDISSWNNSLCSFEQGATSSSVGTDPMQCALSREFSFSTHATDSPLDTISPIDLWNSTANLTTAPSPPQRPQQNPITSPHWSDPVTLSQFLVELLEQHLKRSKSILRTLPRKPIVMDLLDLSPSLVLSIGLEALSETLRGQLPSTYIEIFSLTHLAYAAAVTAKNNMTTADVERLFTGLEELRERLVDEDQKLAYKKIASAIWKPVNFQDLNVSKSANHELTTVCKHFLDILEILSSPTSPSSSHHPDFLFTVKTQIIGKLIQEFYADGLIEDLIRIEERAEKRQITDFRALELALICLNHDPSRSDDLKQRFAKTLETIFNPIYARLERAFSRDTCYIKDMALLKQVIDLHVIIDDELSSSSDFDDEVSSITTINIQQNVAAFAQEADETLQTQTPAQSQSPPSTSPPPFSRYRCPCGYEPQGSDRWKPSNLARHKRTQHPSSSSLGGDQRRVYECSFPGCGSRFSRSDNLGQHVREKGHAVLGDEGEALGRKRRRIRERGRRGEVEGSG